MLEKTFFATCLIITVAMTSLLLILPTSHSTTTHSDSNNRLLIENLRIFDGERVIEPTSIVVEKGLIESVGENPEHTDFKIINATGKTLIPGLIDAHTHNYGDSLRDAINFGVTAHLDMFTNPLLLRNQKSSRESTVAKQHADLFSAGMLATAPGGHGTQFGQTVETIDHPDQAKAWVARRIAEGSDFIKLVYMPDNQRFASLDRPTAAALINAAQEKGLLAVAHISTLEDAQALLDEGINGLVHIFADQLVTPQFLQQAKKQELFVIPTLSVISTANKTGTAQKLATDQRVAPYLQAGQAQQLLGDFGASEWPGFILQNALENTRLMHEAGIAILAGSDAPNPGTSFGVSLHQELALLVKAGLTPAESLRAATSTPTDAFGIKHRGRIRPGQRADFILVEGDPSSDINVSLSIDSIYKNGQKIARLNSEKMTAGSKIQSSELSDFAQTLLSPSGMMWVSTDDSMINGLSTAELELINGNLKVRAEINQGFMFPWAGAALFGNSELDISDYRSLELTVRGTAGSYRVMTFSGSQTGAPPSQNFDMQDDWQTLDFALTEFPGLLQERLNGLAIVAGPGLGEFEYYIKDVKLKR